MNVLAGVSFKNLLSRGGVWSTFEIKNYDESLGVMDIPAPRKRGEIGQRSIAVEYIGR